MLVMLVMLMARRYWNARKLLLLRGEHGVCGAKASTTCTNLVLVSGSKIACHVQVPTSGASSTLSILKVQAVERRRGLLCA